MGTNTDVSTGKEAEVIKFFVPGEPQPFPKKRSNRRTGMIYTHDPGGIKRGWMNAVEHYGKQAMADAGFVQAFGAGDAVYMRCVFYRTKPLSLPKRLLYPLTKPDLDNYEYAISNALIGVCYHDDSRVVSLVVDKRWATREHPAGVEVEIRRLA